MTRKTLFLLAGGSLLLFTVAGGLIMHFAGPVSLDKALAFGLELPQQILWGLGLGILIGSLAWKLIKHPFLSGTRTFFEDIIGPWRLTWWEVLLVSLSAGIGEEILFRGAIQPLIGIGWTSLLFVLLHGYINPFNAPLSVYGLFMVIAVAVLGFVAFRWGLIAAMTAHTVIDIILLQKLGAKYQR